MKQELNVYDPVKMSNVSGTNGVDRTDDESNKSILYEKFGCLVRVPE